jgi:hypothetical protein
VKTSRHDLDPGRQHSAPAFQHIGDPKIFLDLVPAPLAHTAVKERTHD